MAMNSQYGVSTWLWTSPFTTDSIELLFKKVADLGFTAIEIAVEDPAIIDNAAVKKGLDKYNLTPIVCAAFGSTRDLTHEDPAVHEHCLRYIEACLQCCKD
jgi:D-psicose/D-tagatose/L-ribulose 3-epimerase